VFIRVNSWFQNPFNQQLNYSCLFVKIRGWISFLSLLCIFNFYLFIFDMIFVLIRGWIFLVTFDL